MLEALQDIDFSDRKTQLAAAGAVVVVGFVALKARGKKPGVGDAGPAPGITVDTSGFGTRSDAQDIFDGSPGVIGWVGNAGPGPTPAPVPVPTPTPAPAAGTFQVIRGGKATTVKAAPAGSGISCPAGYVAAQDQSGKFRCTRITDVGLGTGEKLTFHPKAAGQAGQGPPLTGVDVNPHGAAPFHPGTVGGFSPFPAPIVGGATDQVRAGESLQDMSSRLYGTPDGWQRLTRLNPELYRGELREGDALKVL